MLSSRNGSNRTAKATDARPRAWPDVQSQLGDFDYMAKILFLAVLLILVNGCQIYTGNMNKAPTRWVTVLDADTGAPIEGVALGYYHTAKPYFIVSSVVGSCRTYATGPDGRAYVPRNEHLKAVGGYVFDVFRHPYPSYKNTDVYYVRTLDSHMKLMDERLKNEKK